ncbi:hypothetical protein LBMAG42_21230 [Deltaproteobacteria bacterium]|nr:hypothetical protein LBMAG42_21230 [Deltaproteobacteria bacterium]
MNELSDVTTAHSVGGQADADDNDADSRAVDIRVTWRPCRESERAGSSRV